MLPRSYGGSYGQYDNNYTYGAPADGGYSTSVPTPVVDIDFSSSSYMASTTGQPAALALDLQV